MTKRTKHPLVGKTRVAAKAARKAGMTIVGIPLAKSDPSDFRGFPPHAAYSIARMLRDAMPYLCVSGLGRLSSAAQLQFNALADWQVRVAIADPHDWMGEAQALPSRWNGFLGPWGGEYWT